MNLATRCPACGTVFRVVQDQLRVSAGWVRCGRCAGVFDAAVDLFDIDQGTPVQLDPAPAHETVATAAEAGAPAVQTDADLPQGDGVGAPWRPAPEAMPDGSHETLLRAPSPRVGEPDAAAGEPQDIVITDHVPAAASLADAGAGPLAAVDGLAAGADPADAPTFVRAADRAARWRSPGMRTALAALAVLMALLLALQGALLWRDALAAQLPTLEPLLAALCRGVGCRIEPLMRIELLSLESSNLARLDGATQATEPGYRLSLLLRNRADVPLMAPALDLSLTDGRGQLVARRVLRLAELGAPQTVIDAGQELALQALLATGAQRVEGYTVELFYP